MNAARHISDSSPEKAIPNRDLGVALLLGLLGALGLLAGRGGVHDPQAMFAWLVISAPAAGAFSGALGIRLWPTGLIAPGLWSFLLLETCLLGERELPAPFLGFAVVTGFYLAGYGLGLAFGRTPCALAGVLLVASLVLSGLSTQGGWARAGTQLARTHPGLAAYLVDASPLVLAFECAGLDWTHAHPEVYARSGVEWFPRQPFDGTLVALSALLIGVLLALAGRRFGTRGRRARS